MNIDVKIKEEATFWVTCEKEGLSAFQKEELHHWLAQNPLHVKAYQRIRTIYSMSQSLLKENAEQLSITAHKEAQKIKLFEKTKYFARVATILLVISVGTFGIYDTVYALKFTDILSSDTHPLLTHVLPDGSRISCDAKTNMRVAFYANKRVVTLDKGAAMFEVAKDAKRAFIIQSDKINIEVVGTKFEVIHADDSTTINVEEGIVRTYYDASWREKKNEVLLLKADSITYTHEGVVRHYAKINPTKIALWRDNLINFNQVTLKHAMDEFAKYTTIAYSFGEPELENYVITGEFSSNQLDIFLQNLTKIYPLKIAKNDEKIVISKKSQK
ncbi:FecR family protein [Sulfurospirillum barnesii]|uniref:Fe2+-dicitrate sensor, membrane component n=1 Tax=Sulfurospirillum barnesii (strain ATCC 700032 / DSM 10660 / SES-3) TaxID=760154 RepID=I3XZA8_SULBS|nr:FecR domain-containing protein [Sulfurospirillum barnesii]AFL69282.1 Fe2+-dicitrate sensor, membrane component [Sulfurospirillum barnesii SES-3]